jgi:hypothetical protein
MRFTSVSVTLLLGCALSAGVARAINVNGLKVNPRVFNDHPDSTLNITSSNSVNDGAATIDDRYTEGGPGVNRHDVLLSVNGGTTAAVFGIANRFTFETLVDLTGGANSPRKEAGIRLNSPITGDVLFIVNSDAGEIAAFGGGGPFFSFGNNAGNNGYTPGTTILMGLTYIGKSGANAATLNYFIDRDPGHAGGESSSGPLAFSDLELGSLNFNVGVYAQGQSAGGGDFLHTDFTNIQFAVVPEPDTLSTLGLAIGCFAALAAFRYIKPSVGDGLTERLVQN